MKKKNYAERIESLEASRRWLVVCSGLLSLFGLSLGTIIYKGYSSLKEKETELRSDYSAIQKEFIAATNDLAMVRAEGKFAALTIVNRCEELTGLCSNIVMKAKAANRQVETIESDCRLAQDMVRGLDEFVAKNLRLAPQKFTVNVTGVMAECTFVDGVSVPYSRAVAGKMAKALVVVPPGCVCIARPIGKMCELRIQSKIRDRVIVEGGGKMSEVKYFN